LHNNNNNKTTTTILGTMAYYIDDGMSYVCSVVSGLMAAVKIKLLMTILVPWSAAGL
jgi:hypothetical protein